MNLRHKSSIRLLSIAFAAALPLVGAAGFATAAPVVTIVHTDAGAPGDGELTGKLGLAIDSSASRGARANELESGDAGVAVMDKVAAALAISPSTLHWDVVGAQQSGDRIDATLRVITPGYPDFSYPIHWVRVGDSWKLSQDSVCTIGAAVGGSC
ncbi:hypothetical protein [Nocardia aurantia]|uniref:Low molecular weight antigen MTB12-like C-terminal domain-containing protein n=1 Tax=Nocardia aurantia TaxID=2585199 RepID=A0A7K0DGZ2_9NOCA|nr:hypothetical protein [Nocardia aurantia]MQY24917.1 hypothetical protein [Nocardia aurantia]